MTVLEFSLNLPASSSDLIKTATDYKNFLKFLPNQIRNIEILEKNDGKIITQETLFFKSVIKKQFIQKTMHQPIQNNELVSQIIDGPAKNTRIKIIFNQLENGTAVIGEIDLKLSLKYIQEEIIFNI
mgnify:FL=1